MASLYQYLSKGPWYFDDELVTFDGVLADGAFIAGVATFDGEDSGPRWMVQNRDVFLGRVLGPDDGRMGRHP